MTGVQTCALPILSNGYPGNPIQSKKYWTEKPAEAAQRPLGTGPFKFVSGTPGVEVKLEAVPNHWRKTSAFKALTLKVITDEAARLAQVQAGAVDLAVLTPRLSVEAKKSGVTVLGVKEIGTMSMMLGGQFPNDPARPNAYDRNSP